MNAYRVLALLACILLLQACMSRNRTVSPAAARVAAPALSISNQGTSPVVVTTSDGAKSVTVPAQAVRLLQLPDYLPNSWKIRVQNQQTSAIIFDGPLKMEAMKGIMVNDKGLSFLARQDRYRKLATPSPSPFKP